MIWLLCLVADLIATAIGFLLAPILPIFATPEGQLPRWLSWFQTPDNSLDGDEGWKREHWQWRYRCPCSRYIGRVGWLWRNPVYGFDIDAIGFNAHPEARLRVWGNEQARDAVPGWYFKHLRNPDNSSAWQLFIVWNWSASRLFRLNLGWKLWGWKPGTGDKCQFVATVKPCKAR